MKFSNLFKVEEFIFLKYFLRKSSLKYHKGTVPNVRQYTVDIGLYIKVVLVWFGLQVSLLYIYKLKSYISVIGRTIVCSNNETISIER